jgi:hypothetical protein
MTTRIRPAPNASGILVAHMSDVPDAVYCGRKWAGRPASPLANPFRQGDVDSPIESFRGWLQDAYRATYGHAATPAQAAAVTMLLDLADAFREAGRLTLGCWCGLDPCHADVIAAAVIGVVRRDAQYIRLGGDWARVDYDEECAAEGLPFVVTRGDQVLRVCASLGQARETAPLAAARQLQAVAV